MSLDLLAVGYVGIGVVVLAVLAGVRGVPSLADALLVLALWPLWAPFLAVAGHRSELADTGDAGAAEHELLAALARAQASPLAQVLPDADAARVLAARVREARTRLAELEAVLARPDFDVVRAEARVRELAGHGATTAAATARLRVRTLGQLRALRERCRHELEEVHELLAQLVAQAELVRLQPASATGSHELVRELVARVEGLDDLFTFDAALECAPAAGR